VAGSFAAFVHLHGASGAAIALLSANMLGVGLSNREEGLAS
jgi:hypothetical protein